MTVYNYLLKKKESRELSIAQAARRVQVSLQGMRQAMDELCSRHATTHL